MKKLSKIGIAALAVVGMGTSAFGYGTETESGTDVTNDVTLDYKINNVDQDQLTASDTFVVDAKIHAYVSPVTADTVTVDPGDTQVSVAFNVENFGNHATDFLVDFENLLTADTFGLVNPKIYLSDDGFGDFDSGSDTELPLRGSDYVLADLAIDGSAVIYIVGDVPSDSDLQGLVNNYEVSLTAVSNGTSTAIVNTDTEAAGRLDFVLISGDSFANQVAATDGVTYDADGTAGNGDETFKVNNAELTITKSSVVSSDPFGSTPPKRIPGAVIEYTITVTSGAGATVGVENVLVEDDISSVLASATFDIADVVVTTNGVVLAGAASLNVDVLEVDMGTLGADTISTVVYPVTIK